MMKTLLGKRGESLAEALVSVLIIALSAAMLLTMISVSVSINSRANAASAAFYNQLTIAETAAAGTGGTVSVNGRDIPVEYCGESGGLTAYRRG